MAFVSAEVAGKLIRTHIPDDATTNGISPQRAAFVAQVVFTRTGVDISVPQVYAGIGWLRDNPQGASPLLTLYGTQPGYLYSADPEKVRRGLLPRLRYEQTHMRRTNSGIIIPFADLSVAPLDPAKADDMKRVYADALTMIGGLTVP